MLKVGIVSSQGVELFCSRVLVGSTTSRLPEAGSDLVEGPALRLRQLEVGEGEEAEQQHSEDDKDVRATELLRGGDKGSMRLGVASLKMPMDYKSHLTSTY